MSLEYAYEMKGLERDKAVTEQIVEGYKYNLIQNLPPKEEIIREEKLIAPKEKKSFLRRLFSIFS